MSVHKNFISIFLLPLVCNLEAMRVPSLVTICLDRVERTAYQNFNVAEPVSEQAKKMRQLLEPLPDFIQQKIIDHIDFKLCPQWQKLACPLHEYKYLHTLTKYQSYHFGCNSSGFFVHDNASDIPYQKNNEDENDPIQYIARVPNVSRLFGASVDAISFFSSEEPFEFLGKKELYEEKNCVVSTDDNPIMYVATRHKILTFLCGDLKDKVAVANQNLHELSFFNNVKSPSNPIQSLALMHDNRCLYVGCQESSYKVHLATEKVEEIPLKGIIRIIFADDDSLVCMTERSREKTRIMTTDPISDEEKAFKELGSINGIAHCIKNNIIIASNGDNDLLWYDIRGNLLKKFTIGDSLGKPCYFVDDQNNVPSLIKVDKQVGLFYVPEKLTFDSIDKLAYKLAVEKATRKDTLKRLLADKTTLSSFPLPDILRCRIREKLKEQKKKKKKRCTLS